MDKMKKNTLVWQIKPPKTGQNTEGPQKASYIIGTMHVRDASAFKFEKIFKKKILKCQAFATEFNLDEAQNDNGFSFLMPYNLRLIELVEPQITEKISRVVEKRLGVPLTHFNSMKPIVVTNMLTESILSNDRMQSLDETLWRFAAENGRILRGIETFAEQVEILNNMSISEQLDGLKEVTNNFSKFRRQLLGMTKFYEKADIQKLYKAAKKTTKGNRDLLLFDRNEVMAQRIAALSSEMTLCAAIGAGHLAGKKGVLRLLKNKGFTVKPVFV
jgi:uncharacterized protein